MDPSMATVVLGHLTDASTLASESLQEWAWVVFTALFIIGFLVAYSKHAIKGGTADAQFLGEQTIRGVCVALVISGYFLLSMPWMEVMRESGMALSGSSAETVDIGEIARQAGTVSEKIDETIEAMKSGRLVQTLQNVPEIIVLMILKGVVQLLYLIIELIAIWLYAKFILGFLVGGVFVSGLAWSETFQIGMKSIGYVLFSAMPLFLLAFLQGLSEQLLDGVTLVDGNPVTMPVIGEVIVAQVVLVFLSMAAAAVPGEFLMSVVGSSGMPDKSSLPRSMGQGGSAISSLISNTSNMLSGGSGSGGSLPGPSGGGGGAGGGPQSVGSPPSLTFRP